MELSPIVLFAYARPLHTQNVLNSLAQNNEAKDSTLYIYCDGAKENATPDIINRIKEVREIAHKENRFKDVIIRSSAVNKGLANSIIDGVTEVVNKHGKVIILEDDLNLSPFFLHYMNDSLEKYAENKKVGQIGACNFFANGSKFPSHFFLYTPDCLGWATWSDRWKKFTPSAEDLLNKLQQNPKAYRIFNIYGGHNYTNMLKQQIEGKVSSWAVRWQAVCALEGWLTLYPNFSVTQHIESEEATHAPTNIIPPLLNENIDYEKLSPSINLKALKAQQSGYAGKTDFYGVPIAKKLNSPINKNALKSGLKKIIPASLISIYYSLRYKHNPQVNKYTPESEVWKGNYSSWQEAKSKSNGYNSNIILQKCKNSILEVKNGNAAYERDSVLFNKKEYSFALLSGLQKAAIENNNKLVVLDFGGSLGSTFFQNNDFLEGLDSLEWCIIEQKEFVKEGREYIETDNLKFYYTIEECLQNHKPNVVIMSGVLQYIENYQEIIKEINNLRCPYIIIDRTCFIENDYNIITVQTVPEQIYDASYPCWFFSEKFFYDNFNEYQKIVDFESFCDKPQLINGELWAYWKGAILKIKG